MPLYHTILHPTDFDSCSFEAFRVARVLARTLSARVVAFHIVEPPAVVTGDGRVILDPKDPTPSTLWSGYLAAQVDSPGLTVDHAVAVGRAVDAPGMLAELIGPDPAGVLIVMGTHGRTGLRRLIWGNRADEVIRLAPCSVLVVKEPASA